MSSSEGIEVKKADNQNDSTGNALNLIGANAMANILFTYVLN